MNKKNLLLVLLVALVLSLTACSNSNNSTTKDSNATTDETKETNSEEVITQNSKNNSNDESWSKTAGNTNGEDWLSMTEGQKKDIVTGVIQSWVENDYIVKKDYSWFISNLNDFYGSEATDTINLSEAMSQIGVIGDVLEKESVKKEKSYSSKDSGSSSEGEFWCMGKNDTCQNKTSSPTVFFCEECDRNRDNIEDSKQ